MQLSMKDESSIMQINFLSLKLFCELELSLLVSEEQENKDSPAITDNSNNNIKKVKKLANELKISIKQIKICPKDQFVTKDGNCETIKKQMYVLFFEKKNG